MISPTEFTKKIVRVLQRVAPELEPEIKGPLEVRIRVETGTRAFGLTSFYEKISAFDEKWMIEEAVRGIRWASAETTDVSAIIPLIANPMRLSVGPSDEYVTDEINTDLRIVYGVHLGKEARYLRQRELEGMAVPRQSLLAVARLNLDEITKRIQYADLDGCQCLEAGHVYESSFVLFDYLWDGDTFPIDGSPVIAVPHRSMLLFSGENDRAGVRRVREVAELVCSGAKHPISPRLFVRREGKWVRF